MNEMTPDTLDGIDAFQRTAGLRVLALVLRAMEEASVSLVGESGKLPSNESRHDKQNVMLCGLAVRADFVAILQRPPAAADWPAAGSGETLGQLLQRAAGGWMVSDEEAAPTRKVYGEGDPMDGRGAMLGVQALHTELLRYCTSYTADRASWHRWEQLRMTPGSGPAACRGLHEQLKALGQRVRRNGLPPQQWAEELTQHVYPTFYGPRPRAEPSWTSIAVSPVKQPQDQDNDKTRELEEYIANLQSEFPDPTSDRVEFRRRRDAAENAIFQLKVQGLDRAFYKNCKKLPPLQAAYELTQGPDSVPRSDSYVGLFTLVQVAAAAALDLEVKTQTRTALADILELHARHHPEARMVSDLDRSINVNIVPRGYKFDHRRSGGDGRGNHARAWLKKDAHERAVLRLGFKHISLKPDMPTRTTWPWEPRPDRGGRPQHPGIEPARLNEDSRFDSHVTIDVPFPTKESPIFPYGPYPAQETFDFRGANMVQGLALLLAQLDLAWPLAKWDVRTAANFETAPTVRYGEWRDHFGRDSMGALAYAQELPPGWQEWKSGSDQHVGSNYRTAERYPIEVLPEPGVKNFRKWQWMWPTKPKLKDWPTLGGPAVSGDSSFMLAGYDDDHASLGLMHYLPTGYGNVVPLSALMRAVRGVPRLERED